MTGIVEDEMLTFEMELFGMIGAPYVQVDRTWQNILKTRPRYPIPTPQNLRHSGAESAIEGQLRQSKIVEDDARNEDLNESELIALRAQTEEWQTPHKPHHYGLMLMFH